MKRIAQKKMDRKKQYKEVETNQAGWIEHAILPACLFAFLLFLGAMHVFRINSNTYLNGVTLAPMPALTASGMADGSYQRDWEKWLNDNYFGHAATVKTCNQILYSIFQDGNGDMCIGVGHDLISRTDALYIAAPDRLAQPQEAYDAYAQTVYEFQTKLKQYGKEFVYLIAPMKVDIYPDMIPWNYRLIKSLHKTSGPDNRERTIAAFEKYGVNYYDLTDDMKRMRESEDFEIFPITGYHWSLTALAHEMNTLFQELSVITPGIDYPEVNVIGLTNDVYGTDMDLYYGANTYSTVKSDEYTSPIIDYPRISSDKVYYVGTSMGNVACDALAFGTGRAFDQIIYQMYSTTQRIANEEGKAEYYFQETDPPEALHIMEHIQDSDLIIMEQPSHFGPWLHSKFLNYANEHMDGLCYRLGDNVVTDYEGKFGVTVSGDYGLEAETWRWVEKDCQITVYGDELKDAGRDIRMSISMNSYHADQSVRISVNGEKIAVCQTTPAGGEFEVTIPADIINPEVNSIKLTMLGEPYSPKQLGESEDARYLGFALNSMVLEVSG